MALRMTKAQAAAMQQVLQHRLDGEEPDDVTPPKKRDNEEERSQERLFARSEVLAGTYPALNRLFSTLNGVFLPPGILKRVANTGLRKGVLDVWLPVPRTDPDGTVCPGLVLDMKTRTGRPTPDQLDWALYLASCGWRVYFCGGGNRAVPFTPLEDAWFAICAYLGISGEDHARVLLTAEEEYRLLQIRAARRSPKLPG